MKAASQPPTHALPLEGGGAGRGWLLTHYAVVIFLAFPAFASGLDLKKLDMDKVRSGAEKVAKGVTKMSDADEAALGKEVAAYLSARYGLLRNEGLTRYVGLVGKAVARRGDRPYLAYHFGVLDTEEVNAYAAPGGYVFVTKGLLRFVKDESELAGVLAHEIAHVALRHVAREIQKGNLLEGGLELATARKNSPEAFKAVNDFTIQLLFKGFSRQDEAESDRAALDYAARTGYDPAGLGRVLSRMAEGKKDENRFKALNKSHPPAQDRLRTVQEKIAGQSWKAGLVVNDARFTAETVLLR